MNLPPLPSTYGQTKGFHKKLFQELVSAGYEEPELFDMSLSKALLARYGSWQVIDQELGEGTFQGVKQVEGGLSSWRKAWIRVRHDQKARYVTQVAALDALVDAIEVCKKVGVPNDRILNKVQTLVYRSWSSLAA